MVVDLHGVNSLIIPKLVQLPQIEELLETITSSKPRYQVGLHEESRDLKSFIGPDRHHRRYTRCAMGLSNSQSQLNLVFIKHIR